MKLEKLTCPSCNAPIDGDFIPNQTTACAHCGTALLFTNIDDNEGPFSCPKCSTLNANQIRFCVKCGHQIKVDCLLCHAENKINASHCIQCGVHLVRTRARRKMLSKASALLRQERLDILKEKEARQQRERLERLIDALDEPENHDMAIYKINQIGIAAVDALIETLHHDQDVDARYGSARALGQIMAEQELRALDKGRTTTVKALIQALADPEVAVRYWATDSLGRCRSKLAISPLQDMLKSSHNGIRDAAARSLQAIGGKRAEEILSEYQNQKQGWLSRIW